MKRAQKKLVAKEILRIAGQLVAEAEDEEQDDVEVEDETFNQKIRDLRNALPKIRRKKNFRLSKFGISAIRPNAKVSDVIDALMKVTAS